MDKTSLERNWTLWHSLQDLKPGNLQLQQARTEQRQFDVSWEGVLKRSNVGWDRTGETDAH